MCVLRGGEQRLAGCEHPAPAFEDGIGCVRMLKQPKDDRPLGGDVPKEPAQPGLEPVPRTVTLDCRGGGADLIDLTGK